MTSLYSVLQQMWRKRPEELRELMKKRLMKWRREKSIVRVERPLRIDRARQLGYRAKQGVVVLRVRVRKGGFQKPRPRAGRRPKAIGVVKHKVNVTMKEEAINKVRKRYPNLHVLGAYPLAYDSLYKWFEVIAVDPHHPAIKNDTNLSLSPKLLR
ncbi:MAG: 50S ribosomal protein L15e [Aigarchaeota archaeon]|nr:50S ribosomal protein L15e [Candidatus Pelearchaeum maunauluense]